MDYFQYFSIIGFIFFLFFIYKQKKNSILLGLFFYILFHYSISAAHEIYTFILNFKFLISGENYLDEYMIAQNPIFKNLNLPANAYTEFQNKQFYIRKFQDNFNNYLFIIIMIISSIFLVKKLYLKKIKIHNFNILFFFSILLLMVLFNSIYQNFSNFKIIYRDLFLIGFSFFGLLYYLTYYQFEEEVNISKNVKYFIAIILFLMFLLSFLEVNLGLTFSHTRTSNDENIFRANNLFLNSNVLAIWLTFFYFSISFLHSNKKKIDLYYVLIITLLSLNLYLTGSRAIIYLILMFEIIKFILFPKRLHHSIPVIVLIITFITFYLITLFLSKNLILNSHNLSILFERYVISMTYIPIAVYKILHSFSPNFLPEKFLWFETLPSEIKMSIRGRLASGTQSDNGWYNLIYQNFFFSIFYIVFIIFLKLKSLYNFFKLRKYDYLFIFLILNFSSLLGFIINFTTFPIWVLYVLMFVFINFFIYEKKQINLS